MTNGDISFEPDESFFVNVTNVVGANVVGGQGLGTITNDDIAGAALSFDGVDDYVDAGGVNTFNVPLLTVSAWVKTTQNTGRRSSIINKYLNSSFNGYNVFIFNGDIIAWYFKDASNYVYDFNASEGIVGGFIADGNWHHITFTVDNSGGKLYIDGNLGGSRPSTGTPGASTSSEPLRLATTALHPNDYFQGTIDEVNIWNRALCQPEIVHNMACELPATSSGLVASYHFNQGTAGGNNSGITTLTDASGSGNHGTLINFALTGATSNWVAPGAVTSGVSCSAYLDPEINVKGNNTTITDGDATPSLADHTDFGNATTGGGNLVRTFTIENTGTGNLTVSGISVRKCRLFRSRRLSELRQLAQLHLK